MEVRRSDLAHKIRIAKTIARRDPTKWARQLSKVLIQGVLAGDRIDQFNITSVTVNEAVLADEEIAAQIDNEIKLRLEATLWMIKDKFDLLDDDE